MNNCVKIVEKTLDSFKIRYNKRYLEETVTSNPSYPSLQCLVDTMDLYGINNMTIKTNREKLTEIPIPSVLQTYENNSNSFVLLKEVNEEFVIYLDELGNATKMSTEKFCENWTEIALLLEKTSFSGQPQIGTVHKKDTLNRVLVVILVVLLSIWGLYGFLENKNLWSFWTLFLIIKVLGVVVSTKLLLHENRIIPTEFCKISKTLDCDSILESKYSKIFNGTVNLSTLSFTYFISTIICLVIDKASLFLIFLLCILTILDFLY
ncbi:cysteine peptidase family C39 domain-containing protein [Zhouia amylolytica]|uniref:Peptidase C39 domain-containing protein n=1 Tax=Zhouia amylolytica AD3 TaxID=1286632 RepID=W2UQ75_9FLAO|nr:cysteine peptidase family C39 domain-containing protein [Zhouia amylolytica]ETN96153.1 hypothetical protein P278_09540 [Zhouia amylolytica AD3]